ncbi:MAG TPA: hypothetical protein PLE30_11450 [Candidatus Kapabacteria bacterium]|nr:hypothetical protein [Candidatus Kapabacteria bacterium]
MKKMILIFALIVMYSVTIFSNPPIGVTMDTRPWRMMNFLPMDRGLPSYTPACSCPCDSMIKAAEIMSPDEGEVYLRGGRKFDSLNCQEFRLLLSACNGKSINAFSLTFDYDNAENPYPCFSTNQSFYKVNSANILEKVGSINRPSGNSVNISLGSDSIPACLSKIITFYVCTTNDCQFSRVNVSVNFFSIDSCTSRSLIFQYDGITGESGNEININTKSLPLKDIIDKYQFTVYDVYGNLIGSYINLTENDLQTELTNLKLGNGIYIIHKLNYDNKESIEKILINN